MKLCPTCSQTISFLGNKAVRCALCHSDICTGCETIFRTEPRGPHGFPLCRKCYRELESDEILGLELVCPNCSKEYFIREYYPGFKFDIHRCRCGIHLSTRHGRAVKTMLLSCPDCEREVDPFEERLLSCALCGELFCSHCEKTFRSESRGQGLFPLCRECYGSLRQNETVMLGISCENCSDELRFFDPSKIACLHGEEVRLSDPFPVLCKCGKFHNSTEGKFRKVRLFVDANQQVNVLVGGNDGEDEDEELIRESGNEGKEEDEELIEGEENDMIDVDDELPVTDGGAWEEAELEEDGEEKVQLEEGGGEDVQLEGGLMEDWRPGEGEDDELVEDSRSGEGEEELVEDPEMDDDDDEALCESCGSEVPMSSEKCPVCGAEFMSS